MSCHLAGRLDERPAVVHVLEIGEDDVGVRIVPPLGDEIDLVECGLVAERDDVVESDAVPCRPGDRRGDEGPRLAHERHGSLAWGALEERRVQPVRRTDDADAVRTDQVAVVVVGSLPQFALASFALRSTPAEAGRDDDGAGDADVSRLADDIDHGPSRNDDHGQVDRRRLRRLADGRMTLLSQYRVPVRVDRNQVAVEPGEVPHQGETDRPLAVGRADEGDSVGVEQTGEVGHCGPSPGAVAHSGHSPRFSS